MRELFLYIQARLTNFRFFWLLRTFYFKLSFFLSTKLFQLNFRFKDLSSSANIAREVSSASSRPFFAAVFIGSLLFIISLLLLGVSTTSLKQNLVIWITPVFNEIEPNNAVSYDAFFIGIATVVGLFLTLYITNLSTLAGSLYAKLPRALRDLYIQDRVGNSYVAFLIFLTISSLFTLGVGLLTDFRPKLFIYVYGLLSLLAIQAFAALGNRSFRFFDPTTLIGEIFYNADVWISQATTNGYLWNEPTFQNHYHSKLVSILKGINSLLELANDENTLRREPLRILHNQISDFLIFYVSQKHLIPTKSRFFQQTVEHRSWYLTEHTDVDLATRTHTDLLPKKKANSYWMEDQILDSLFDKFTTCLTDRKEVAEGMLEDYSSIISKLGREWEIKYACDKLEELSGYIFANIEKSTDPKSLTKHDLGLFELLSIIPINLFLGYLKYFKDKKVTNKDFFNIKDLTSASNIYAMEIPIPMLPRLELLHDKLLFERRIEGRNVTPDWSIRQEIFQDISFSLQRNFDMLINNINVNIYSKANELVTQQKFVPAVILIGRGLEYNHKLLTHQHLLQEVAAILDQAKVEETLPWPTWTWTTATNEITEYMNTLYKLQSSCIAGLSISTTIEDVPDFFGKAIHFAGELCFKYGKENDLDNLKTHFYSYFYGALQMFDKLRAETQDWLPESAIHAFSQPFVELVELSGYLIFFAEFHHNPELWRFSKSIWDEYIGTEVGHAKARFAQMSAILSLDKRSFSLSHRQFRTQWKMQVDEILSNIPRRVKETHTKSIFNDRTEVSHDSKLVRVLGGSSSDFPMSFYDGVDILVDQYLLIFKEAQNLDFGTRNDLTEHMTRPNALNIDEDLPNEDI